MGIQREDCIEILESCGLSCEWADARNTAGTFTVIQQARFGSESWSWLCGIKPLVVPQSNQLLEELRCSRMIRLQHFVHTLRPPFHPQLECLAHCFDRVLQ